MTALRAVPEPPPIGALTKRELDVLSLIAQGSETEEIALALTYSVRTIKNISHDILTKLGVPNRAAAVHVAHVHGLLDSAPISEATHRFMSAARAHMDNLERENASLRAMKADALQALLRER